ncbi:heme ABC exporter ATP-binding protein CcmA [Piscinibacter sp.]|uniref:heme ABC exporter ATP-binding protein CcmA n=1 Tax=Piscinibacter sp. TaxID=1903157 RepID=UPI002BCC2146|nr:heme ABC exporter ATP-binding protein CcmA [Albitalea sp.]HUG22312.1 heme ABC exporter ATP-binding protein CcmA [Albitalea sp.]
MRPAFPSACHVPHLASSLHPVSPSAPPHLTARGLACRRGSRLLFHGLAFDVGAGQVVWVRGRNGSGKTSLLRLAAGLSSPEQGEIGGHGTAVEGPRCVFIGHTNALKDDLRVDEALAFLLRIHGRPSDAATVQAALEPWGMLSRRTAPVRTLSQGQRRRVALARLAVEDGTLPWILDEPFDALDADGAERLSGLLHAHLRRGGGVLLSSHVPLNAALLQPIEIDLDRYS